MSTESLTNEVRLLRFLAQDMTQADLGRRVGLTRQTIAAIEQGRYSPSLEVAFRIAHVFGKRIDDVFKWTPADAAQSDVEPVSSASQ